MRYAAPHRSMRVGRGDRLVEPGLELDHLEPLQLAEPVLQGLEVVDRVRPVRVLDDLPERLPLHRAPRAGAGGDAALSSSVAVRGTAPRAAGTAGASAASSSKSQLRPRRRQRRPLRVPGLQAASKASYPASSGSVPVAREPGVRRRVAPRPRPRPRRRARPRASPGSSTAASNTSRPWRMSHQRKYWKPSSEQPPLMRYAAPHRSQRYASASRPRPTSGRSRGSRPPAASRAGPPSRSACASGSRRRVARMWSQNSSRVMGGSGRSRPRGRR